MSSIYHPWVSKSMEFILFLPISRQKCEPSLASHLAGKAVFSGALGFSVLYFDMSLARQNWRIQAENPH